MADNGLERTDGTNLQVGDRIVSDNHWAFIRFIGEVPPTKGIWLGVEWDNPERGKHDGCHENKRYFHTSHAKSGSFVRSNKVVGGITAVQALHERYGLKLEGDAGVKTQDLFVTDGGQNQTVVEMVGAQKINKLQSQFHKLKTVSFHGLNVYSAGPKGEFGRMCPNVTELELSQCLVPSWQRLAEIVGQLPHLKVLNISENRLELAADPPSLRPCFSKLRVVTMNNLGLSWKEVLAICSMFPVLEELHVGHNGISALAHAPPKTLENLRVLDLMTNNISDWDEILKLGILPKLETLNINENKIQSIYFGDCGNSETTASFSTLKVLYIKRNEITEWSSIDALHKLESLTELLFVNHPLLATLTLETTRQLVIAKIGGLQMLNRNIITYEERKGAEIDYLKRFGKEWRKSGGHSDERQNKPSEAFTSGHPRYQDIVDKWGAPEDSELTEKSTALKDNLIALKIESVTHPERGVLHKKLPGTMTVQKLKTLVQRLFKMHCEPHLTYTSHKMTEGPEIELDNDMRLLSFFSIESGDTMLVKW